MASTNVALRSAVCSFVFFLLCTAVTADDSTTDDRNLTAPGGSFTSTRPTEVASTSPASSNTEEPPRPTRSTEPLPVSGRLLTPVTRVDLLCPCDEHEGVCDVSCCCDGECVEEVSLFTGCSVGAVRGNNQLCSQNVATYSLVSTVDGYSKLRASVQKETNYDILCIQSQNRVDGLSHPSPALPTDSNFDTLFKRFPSFTFGSEPSGPSSAAELQILSGYQYGDVMATAGPSGQTGFLRLPAPGVTADCMDGSPAVFLRDQSSRCSRRFVLTRDCSSLPALSMDTYTNIQLFAGKNTDAAVAPVEVSSVILQSVEGTQTELQVAGGENVNAVLLSPTLCANVVLKVFYVVKYNPAGEIVNATVSLVLGFVRKAAMTLQQEFHIKFVQEDVKDETVRYSGNPGYVVGLPLVSGTRTAGGITRSLDPRDALSLLHSTEDQDCLQGAHQRSPVQFGRDSASGCILRLEDASNCSLVREALLDVLRGSNYPQYVASFGNSPLDNPLDWVPVQRSFNPREAQSCVVPLSLHLEVEWTKYGSLVNPQARIVSVREVIQTNPTSLASLSGGGSFLPVRSSVAFIPVSAAAAPAYRATPTIDAKLPPDFFSPLF